MARVCEICGRKEENLDQQHSYDILDICPECSNDRIQPNTNKND